MLTPFFDSIIYYCVSLIGIIMISVVISMLFGGQFAGELFIIIFGMALLAFLDFSLYEIIFFCLIINVVLFLARYFFVNRGYAGQWRDKSGRYILNIEENDENIFIETNLLSNFDIELAKRSIKLVSATGSCIIKKHMSNKLKLMLDKTQLTMHKVDIRRTAKRASSVVKAKQQALLGLVLGAIFAIVYTAFQVETNNLLFFEALLNNIVTYSIYGFGYIFSLNFFIFLSEIIYNITDSVISMSSSVSLLSILITITLIFTIIGLAFIPGIYIGIKAILDEMLQAD